MQMMLVLKRSCLCLTSGNSTSPEGDWKAPRVRGTVGTGRNRMKPWGGTVCCWEELGELELVRGSGICWGH